MDAPIPPPPLPGAHQKKGERNGEQKRAKLSARVRPPCLLGPAGETLLPPPAARVRPPCLLGPASETLLPPPAAPRKRKRVEEWGDEPGSTRSSPKKRAKQKQKQKEPIRIARNDVPHLERFRTMGMQTARSFIKRYSLYGHHRESFMHLLVDQLPRILSEKEIVSNHKGRGIYIRVDIERTYVERAFVQEEGGVLRPLDSLETHARRISLTGSVRCDMRSRKYHADPDTPGRMVLREDMLFPDVELFVLPLMDGTDAVHNFDKIDPIRYARNQATFVMNGHRKIVRTQNNPRICFPFVTIDKKTGALDCEMRSMHPYKIRSSSTLCMFMSREKRGGSPKVTVLAPFVAKAIPVTVFFRLFGVDTIAKMQALVCGRNSSYEFVLFVRSLLFTCRGVKDPECLSLQSSVDDLFVWIAEHCGGAQATGSSSTIGSRSRGAHTASMRHLWGNEVLPHLDLEGDMEGTLQRKASFFALALRKTILVYMNKAPTDAKDDCRHRRFTTSGRTLAIKIRQLFRRFSKAVSCAIMRAIENSQDPYVLDIVKEHSTTFTRGLRSCMTTGNFSVLQQKGSTQAGVSQVFNSTNIHSRMGHATSLNTPVSREGRQLAPRALQTDSFGIIDPVDTPDSRNVGLVGHHTVCARFGLGHSEKLITSVLRHEKLVLPRSCDPAVVPTLVVVNGALAARTTDGPALVLRLREMRRLAVLPAELSILYDEDLDQVVVDGEPGAAMRPVFVRDKLDEARRICAELGRLNNLRLLPELMIAGAVIFLNKEEERSTRCATTLYQMEDVERKHAERHEGAEGAEGGTAERLFTHVEIHPETATFSTVSGCVPHAGHNQGPRLVYGASMAKQAIAAQHPIFAKYQLDSQSNILMYPQHMVDTDVSKLIGIREEPVTQMWTIGIGQWDGLTQEDAIVVRQSAIERGLGYTLGFQTVREVEKEHAGGAVEMFCNPTTYENVRCRKQGSFDAISKQDGLPIIGAVVYPQQPLIGKVIVHTVYHREQDGQITTRKVYTDCSVLYQGTSPARIESVFLASQATPRTLVVRTCGAHMLEVGDKAVSQQAQKGTISQVIPDADMPFTMDGISPDILIAGHGFTSRMTLGQLISMLQSKLDALRGTMTDAGAFRGIDVSKIIEALKQVKPGAGGHEFMTCGRTGQPIGTMFVGLVPMMVLRHQVDSKVHARARGPVTASTRQAVEGKKGGGGLRFGDMERLNVSGLGCSMTVKDFMLETDKYKFSVCCKPGCHQIATEPTPVSALGFKAAVESKARCPRCKSTDNLAPVEMPFAAQLLKKHLAAANIDLQYIPEESAESVFDE